MLKRAGNLVYNQVHGFLASVRDGLEKLLQLPRNIKQACLLVLDMVFVALAMWSAVAFRYGHLGFKLGPVEYFCALVTVLASAVIFLRLGLYRAVIRYMGHQARNNFV